MKRIFITLASIAILTCTSACNVAKNINNACKVTGYVNTTQGEVKACVTCQTDSLSNIGKQVIKQIFHPKP